MSDEIVVPAVFGIQVGLNAADDNMSDNFKVVLVLFLCLSGLTSRAWAEDVRVHLHSGEVRIDDQLQLTDASVKVQPWMDLQSGGLLLTRMF